MDNFRFVETLKTALAWYGEQARLARLLHSGGDIGRHELAADGGKKAKVALDPKTKLDDTIYGMPEVSRVEVIGDGGRIFTNHDICDVQVSIQDGGRTLKVFLAGNKNLST